MNMTRAALWSRIEIRGFRVRRRYSLLIEYAIDVEEAMFLKDEQLFCVGRAVVYSFNSRVAQ